VLDAQDKQEVPLVQQRCLDFVGQVEEAMVKGFPFDVPAEYANLPQLKVPPAESRALHRGPAPARQRQRGRGQPGGGGALESDGSAKPWLGPWLGCEVPLANPTNPVVGSLWLLWLQGRATVQMDVKFTDARENLATGGRMTVVLDGYNAPVRCACFPTGLVSCEGVGDDQGTLLCAGFEGTGAALAVTRAGGRGTAGCAWARPSATPPHTISPLRAVAPLPACSAGDFADLVRRGFYDGMEIQRADGFVVQTGKPEGDVSGGSAWVLSWRGRGCLLTVVRREIQLCRPASPAANWQRLYCRGAAGSDRWG
jgi:hypothetical protein